MPSLPANQRLRIRILQALGLLLIIPFMTMSPEFSGDGSRMVEYCGVVLVLICVVGRMWCILYIGSRKNRELVQLGPYSMSRNPLYFFSMLGAAGVGLFVGSLTLAAALVLLVYLVLTLTANKEAAHLTALFGDDYVRYAQRTPRVWPNPMLYREAEAMEFSPRALRRTFLDGLLFIAALPLVEVMEEIRAAGDFPVLFTPF